MAYVIIARNPSGMRIVALAEENEADNLFVFDTYDDAERAAEQSLMCRAWPYAIVETP